MQNKSSSKQTAKSFLFFATVIPRPCRSHLALSIAVLKKKKLKGEREKERKRKRLEREGGKREGKTKTMVRRRNGLSWIGGKKRENEREKD